MSRAHFVPLPLSEFCRRAEAGRTVRVLILMVSSARDLHGESPLTTPTLVT